MSPEQTTAAGAGTARMTLAKALTAGLRRAMEQDPHVLLMGEDIGSLGGVYRVTEGLKGDFGAHRVRDTPLGEAGIVGTAIGMAMRGHRPVCEIQFDGFTYPAYNQITSQLAKMHARTDGAVQVPVTIRIPYGGLIGSVEHHSESPEALFAHTAGLRILTPSSPQDAYWMMQQAVAHPDPVIFFEPKRRYWLKGEVDLERPSTEDPFSAQILRPGKELTLVAWGPLVPVAMAAAQAAEADGRSVEVIDLRSLSPIDLDTLVESARRTGRMVVAHEAPVFSGLGAEIAAAVTEHCFYSLESPVLRVGGFHLPYPPAGAEAEYVPDLDRMLDAVDRAFDY